MDRLSQLPDDLLIKILSFVPTKCAVATSILSKRWLSLWTLVASLVFEDFSEEEDEEINEIHVRSLSQFVSGTLLLHKAVVLERFHLNSASECSAREIGLWVRIAVDRFVRDLKISFCYDHCLVNLPSRLFRCETLETLQLRRVILSEVPCRLSFPSLTKLRLLSVKYSDDGSFSRIVSNCPILDDLVVETCHGDNVVTFTVNLPSLQSLSVRNTVRESPPDDHLFVIHSQSLKQLDIVDYFGELKRIGNLPKLYEANLQSMSYHANVLESFTFVRRLYVCLDGEVLLLADTISQRLRHLKLSTYGKMSRNLLLHLLKHCPKLQVLKLQEIHWRIKWPVSPHTRCKAEEFKDPPPLFSNPSSVPECLSFHLKTFGWKCYKGTEEEKEKEIVLYKPLRSLYIQVVVPGRNGC
ncbi:F-box/FBD/LRR-repeat protein At5g56420-like [Brassica napus]|uniref:F-box/FBD/LRR-repeat protein At5g56420-like n=1 Tax=Brassica napus TaxID=3708 RepID=UPI002079075A|nr:F-box/FBD/LRR-repeat protein At5g56420-like [Brassica napus]